MKLKDILPYCIDDIYKSSNRNKYYWLINGVDYYQIDQIESFTRYNIDSQYTVTLSQCNGIKNTLMLNLEHDITIFDNFILVHNIGIKLPDENKLFRTQEHYIDNNTKIFTEYYILGLVHTSGETVKNLRHLFKDLVDPSAPPKPLELGLEEKVDILVDELMKDSKTKAIKKLKKMLNERL